MKKAKFVALALLALLVVFVTLKLTHAVAWSWWLVLSPALFPIALAIFFALLIFAILVSAPDPQEDEEDYEQY